MKTKIFHLCLSSSLALAAAFTATIPALAADDLGEKFHQALSLIAPLPQASIVGSIGYGMPLELNPAQERSRQIGDELFNTSQLLIAGTQHPSGASQKAVCQSTEVGLKLLLGVEFLTGYHDLTPEFNGFREVYWTIRSILECDGATSHTPKKIHLQNIKSPSFCLNLNQSHDGANNNVYLCNWHPDQVWSLEHKEGEWFSLKNEKFGKCLNLQDDYEGKETNVWNCAHHPDQQWRIIRNQEGAVQLQNRAYGKCLTLRSAEINVATEARDCNAGDNAQLWTLVR